MLIALIVIMLLVLLTAFALWRVVVTQHAVETEVVAGNAAAVGASAGSSSARAASKRSTASTKSDVTKSDVTKSEVSKSGVTTSEVTGLEVARSETLPTFADVGGMESVKEQLRTALLLLLDSSGLAAQYEIDWNGVLLHGAPGVGKTLLARACAGEMKINFVYVSTADVVSKWIGAGPGKVDGAFAFARKHTPCILFFDEFDSIAANRGDEHHVEYRRVTNQLLASLEEYRDERGLVVMAATNAYGELDPAVIRPGRFDRHIEITLPDLEARRAIFAVHLGSRPLADDVDLDELALRTEGWSGARIETACDDVAITCAAEATRISRLVPIAQARLIAAIEA